MNKTSLIMAAFILILGITGTGMAADDELVADCKVVSIEGKKVVLDCGEDAKLLEAGSPAKIVPEKKRTSIEGC